MHYVSICLITKNSNEYIREWVDYHIKIGVEHFYIYDDQSNIPLKTILQDYIESGIVTYEYKSSRKLLQIDIYMKCLKEHQKDSFWIAFIDDDEFIFLKKSKDIKEYLKEFENYGGLAINWVMFGSSGHKTKQESVLKSYFHRLPYDNETNRHIKTIVNTQYVNLNEAPKNPHYFNYIDGKFAVNENKQAHESSAFMDFTNNDIQLNHYWTKSYEDMTIKSERGRPDVKFKRATQEFYEFDKLAIIFDNEILKVL